MKRYKATVYDRKTGMEIKKSDSLDSHNEAFNWGCDVGDSWSDTYRVVVEEEGE